MPPMASSAWTLEKGSEAGVFWTELGSPIGLGMADWDLEAFWRDREQPALQLHDFSRPVAQSYAAQGKLLPHAPQLGRPGDRCADPEEVFWDVGTELEEECLSPVLGSFTAVQSRRDEFEALSAGSVSESEELERWMAGSQSQSTEDSTGSSATSSTLDFSEWGAVDPPLGQASVPLSLGMRLGLIQKPKADPSPWFERQTPVKASQEVTSEAKKGSLWGFRRLVPSTTESSAAENITRRFAAEGELERDCTGSDGLASRSASHVDTPVPSGAVVEGLEDLVTCHSVRQVQVTRAKAEGAGCREAEARLQMYRDCFSGSTGASGGGSKEVLDLIPDEDLVQLLRQVHVEEGEMLQAQVPAILQGQQARSRRKGSNVLPAEDEVASNDHGGSKAGEKGSQRHGPWKLIMRKNTEFMEYASWVRDKGSHFGGVEFRGRMLLMPKPAETACPSGVELTTRGIAGSGLSRGEARWSPEAVRDFLLDEVHRAEWDDGRESSLMLEDWDESGCSTARWVRKLPLFLRSREYIVGRRVWGPLSCPGTYYCISKSTDHPAAPPTSHRVRVSKFFSSWRVRSLSQDETQHQRKHLSADKKKLEKESGYRKDFAQKPKTVEGTAPTAEPLGNQIESAGVCAVEIITHYEEESGLPKDLVRVGVAHSLWGHMLKMEHALRAYCASGRNLRHLLPVSLLQAERHASQGQMLEPFQKRLNHGAFAPSQGAEESEVEPVFSVSDVDVFHDCSTE